MFIFVQNTCIIKKVIYVKFIVENSNKIDMHIHTMCSDGYDGADDILFDAKKRNLTCIAFTDHNCDDAYRFVEVKKLAKNYGIKVMPGCEISVCHNGKRLHLLAYDYNPMFSIFVMPKIRKNRYEKNEIIPLKKARNLIHAFGGKAIIAHPFKYKYNGKELIEELIQENCIDGIECIHSYHTQEEIDYLLDVCEKNDLYVSAGSDFHYSGRKIRNSGVQNKICELPVSESTIEEQLIRAKKKYQTSGKKR